MRSRKKLLSMALAGAMVTSMLPMTAFAGLSGEVTSDVTIISPVVRVQVPTKLAVSVNQFEKGDEGSQILSEDFYIKNFSEADVNVSVTSTATIKSDVALASSREAVSKAASDTSTMWLAAAAATGKTGAAYNYGTLKNLTEKDANITSFSKATDTATTSEITQDFYLSKSDAGATTTYNYLEIGDTDVEKDNDTYREFYELTSYTPTAADSDGGLADFNNTLKTGDIYYAATSVLEGEDATKTLTKVEKNTVREAMPEGTNSYYTVAAEKTTDTLEASKEYVWGQTSAQAAENGEAAFRFIGALNDRTSVWTKADFDNVVTTYAINAVVSEKYAGVSTDETYYNYGYYPAVRVPVLDTISTTFAKNNTYNKDSFTLSEMAPYNYVKATNLTADGGLVLDVRLGSDASITKVKSVNVAKATVNSTAKTVTYAAPTALTVFDNGGDTTKKIAATQDYQVTINKGIASIKFNVDNTSSTTTSTKLKPIFGSTMATASVGLYKVTIVVGAADDTDSDKTITWNVVTSLGA